MKYLLSGLVFGLMMACTHVQPLRLVEPPNYIRPNVTFYGGQDVEDGVVGSICMTQTDLKKTIGYIIDLEAQIALDRIAIHAVNTGGKE